ncbi:MAG: helix-turn-helix domain-containing protein, partial [Anaeroplasmataceae bacterium]|nr:helix-turn-helix domain-containing protein [Anaeroplasmataceae bacterium]
MEFKERLKQYRLDKNLTQDDLARQLFVSRQAISKYETGRSYPNLETMQVIAKLLNVSLDELISKEEVAKETIITKQKNRKNRIIFSIIFVFFLISSIATIITCSIALQNKKRLEEKGTAWEYDLVGMVGTNTTISPTIEQVKNNELFGYCFLKEQEQMIGRSFNVSELYAQFSNSKNLIEMEIMHTSTFKAFSIYEVYYKEQENQYIFKKAYDFSIAEGKSISFTFERDGLFWQFDFHFKAVDKLLDAHIYEFNMNSECIKEEVLSSKEYTILSDCLYV